MKMNHDRLVLSLLLVLAILQLILPAQQRQATADQSDFRARISQKSLANQVNEADIEAEIEFGREVAARILGRYKLVRDKKLTRYVNLVGTSVAMHGNRPELDFRFAILATSDVNAYAAPGGYIFVTQGAIQQMTDEAELAGVLAHEIAHSTKRHIVRELGIKGEEGSAQAGLAHLLGALGDPTRMAFKQGVDKAMDILFTKGYGKEDEFEADRTGTLLLTATGYDPLGLARYVEKIGKQTGSAELKIIDDTHPGFAERQAALRSLTAEYNLGRIKNPTLSERFAAYVR